MKYQAGRGSGKGPRLSAGLVVTAALLLMPVLVPGSESLLIMFAPGVAACLILPLSASQGQILLGAIFLLGSAAAFSMGRPDTALWMIQATGTAALLFWRTLKGQGATEIFLSVAFFLCLSLVMAFVTGTGMDLEQGYRLAVEGLSKQLDKSYELYVKGSGGNGAAPEMAIWFQQLKEVVIRYFPGLVMTTMVMAACFNTVLFRRCVAKSEGIQGHAGFSMWRMPDWLVWLWIAAGAACFIPQSLYSTMGMNVLLVISAIYLIEGVATAQYLFERFRVPRWIRWLTWIVIGLQWYGAALLAALGLADTWVDFRSRFRPAGSQDGSSTDDVSSG